MKCMIVNSFIVLSVLGLIGSLVLDRLARKYLAESVDLSAVRREHWPVFKPRLYSARGNRIRPSPNPWDRPAAEAPTPGRNRRSSNPRHTCPR